MITKDEAEKILADATAARDRKRGGWPEPYGLGPGESTDKLYVAGYLMATDYAKEIAEEISTAAGGPGGRVDFRELGWGTMIYACSGTTARSALPEETIRRGIEEGHITEDEAPRFRESIEAKPACGWEHRVWLGLGCEGPDREGETYVPVPFVCGTCPNCGTGSLQHDRWNEDQSFGPRPFPEDAPRFVLPAEEEWEKLAAKGYGGADYVDPTYATTPHKRPKTAA